MEENLLFYDLAEAQKRIWHTQMIYKESSMFNIGGTVAIDGVIEVSLLQRAISEFIRNQIAFQIRIRMVEGVYRQYFAEASDQDIDFIDFSGKPQPKKALQTWCQKEAGKVFTLEDSPLYYFFVYQLSETEYGYFVKLHHVIADGWSIQILSRDIIENYTNLLKQKPMTEQYNNAYLDVISSEKKYFESKQYMKNKHFWLNKYNKIPDLTAEPAGDLKGNRKTYFMTSAMTEQINEFCQNNNYSPNILFIALYYIYLYKTTGNKDIIIGLPVLGRNGRKERDIFGMFVNVLPLRLEIDVEEELRAMLKRIYEELRNSFVNHRYPYNHLLRDLDLASKGCDGLYCSCINYYNTRIDKIIDGISIENTEFYNGEQEYSLQIIIRDWSEQYGLQIDIDYRSCVFKEEQIDQLYQHILRIAEIFLKDSKTVVKSFNILTDEEVKNLIINYNRTDVDYSNCGNVVEQFLCQAKKNPNRKAVCFQGQALSYSQLDQKTDQIAAYLKGKGVKDNVIVAIITEHSIQSLEGILGILKAGGAFLPVNPHNPPERINYILEDADVDIVLTNIKNMKDCIRVSEIIDLSADFTAAVSDSYRSPEILDEHLAYVIYTSGSSGVPKGVMIEHGSLKNYVLWAQSEYISREIEVFPLYSSFAFDLTMTSIFVPLASGGKIMVYQDNEEGFIIDRIMKDNKCTIMKLTPAHLYLLKDRDNRFSSIKKLIVGGDNLLTETAKQTYESFDGEIIIFNEYGPTEATVGCMIDRYDSRYHGFTSVAIGKPVANTQIYLLDTDLQPVPLGVIGEIYIGGSGLARGYLKQPELTQKSFIINLFNNGQRLYRTGDYAKFVANDRIEYLSRANNQVKIRGYRIELGEIESNLSRYDGIEQVIVTKYQEEQKDYLCAYYTSNTVLEAELLRTYLMQFLPDYMLPAYYVQLKEIPLTINGKIDSKKLPKPDRKVALKKNVFLISPEEELLIKVTGEILKITGISPEENFYHLGGDSIKAIQISSKLSDYGYSLKVKDILLNPVISDMAVWIKKAKLVKREEIPEGDVELTPIFKWFFAQNFRNPNYYSQSISIKLYQNYRTDHLEKIMECLIARHHSLRLNCDYEEKRIYYNNANRKFRIDEFDLKHLPEFLQDKETGRLSQEQKASLNLKDGYLIKSSLYQLNDNEIIWFITMHHILIDGISWRILIDEIIYLLQKDTENCIMESTETITYQQWAIAFNKLYDKAVIQKKYWDNVLSSPFEFPADFTGRKEPIIKTIATILDEDETDKILMSANVAYSTHTEELLIAALYLTISEFTGKKDVLIELEGHGREQLEDGMDVSKTVGWFTCMYPMRLQTESSDLDLVIKAVKETKRNVPDYGLLFGMLKNYSTLREEHWVRFNYLGDINYESGLCEIIIDINSDNSDGKNKMSGRLEINSIIDKGRLKTSIIYDENILRNETVHSLLEEFHNNIVRISKYCCDKKEIVFTPNDFAMAAISQEEIDSLFS